MTKAEQALVQIARLDNSDYPKIKSLKTAERGNMKQTLAIREKRLKRTINRYKSRTKDNASYDKAIANRYFMDERARKNENGLFFPSNLIFGDNEFDRDIKREILRSK